MTSKKPTIKELFEIIASDEGVSTTYAPEPTEPTADYIEGLVLDAEGVTRRIKSGKLVGGDTDTLSELIEIAKQAIAWKKELDDLRKGL